MSIQFAIQIAYQTQQWRRGLPPYDNFPCEMPYTPTQFGAAVDTLIQFALDHTELSENA